MQIQQYWTSVPGQLITLVLASSGATPMISPCLCQASVAASKKPSARLVYQMGRAVIDDHTHGLGWIRLKIVDAALARFLLTKNQQRVTMPGRANKCLDASRARRVARLVSASEFVGKQERNYETRAYNRSLPALRVTQYCARATDRHIHHLHWR